MSKKILKLIIFVGIMGNIFFLAALNLPQEFNEDLWKNFIAYRYGYLPVYQYSKTDFVTFSKQTTLWRDKKIALIGYLYDYKQEIEKVQGRLNQDRSYLLDAYNKPHYTSIPRKEVNPEVIKKIQEEVNQKKELIKNILDNTERQGFEEKADIMYRKKSDPQREFHLKIEKNYYDKILANFNELIIQPTDSLKASETEVLVFFQALVASYIPANSIFQDQQEILSFSDYHQYIFYLGVFFKWYLIKQENSMKYQTTSNNRDFLEAMKKMKEKHNDYAESYFSIIANRLMLYLKKSPDPSKAEIVALLQPFKDSKYFQNIVELYEEKNIEQDINPETLLEETSDTYIKPQTFLETTSATDKIIKKPSRYRKIATLIGVGTFMVMLYKYKNILEWLRTKYVY